VIAAMPAARVALFADTFYEVNGAARTCREWDGYARLHGLPFFCVRWGQAPARSGRALELARSRLAFRIDTDLHFDPCVFRAVDRIREALEEFRPDAIHVTSPGDLGVVGSMLAARLKLPLGLSWHTNLHEFAARRVDRTFAWVPAALREPAAAAVERLVLGRVCWFFGRGDLLFAPNPELQALLESRSGRPVHPMARGIDTVLFRPERRTRGDRGLVIGFVGRLMPEKNLRLLPRVAAALDAAGIRDFRFQITGAGSERAWLERHLPHARFTGVLTGRPLAEAYANMDVFAFPSRTDTYGNVVQEAMASGVPAVVSDAGGPRFLVRHGETGWIAESDDDFCRRVVDVARDAPRRLEMGAAARRQVLRQSWENVFAEVYDAYARLLARA
jgi:glycosyltransferase involved in cell wall biosynthesis